MIPSTTTQPESIPFLLVRPVSARPPEALDDDAETAEIPSSKSVPPHTPPPRVETGENQLPSVIVDLHDLEAAEIDRATDVDGLLKVSESLEFPIPIDDGPELDAHSETGRSIQPRPSPPSRGARTRGLAIAMVAALSAAGGTFAGLRALHVPGGSLGAAQHLVR